MKPYLRLKGTYTDGCKRYVIEWEQGGEIKSRAIPRAEKLLLILERMDGKKKKKVTKQPRINGQPPLRLI